MDDLKNLIRIPKTLQGFTAQESGMSPLSDDCTFGWENCDLVCQSSCNTSDEGCTGCQTCQNSCQAGTSCQTSCELSCQSQSSGDANASFDVSVQSVTTTSIVLNVIISVSSGTVHTTYEYSGGSDSGTATGNSTSSDQNWVKTLSGLTPGTTYTITVDLVDSNTGRILQTVTLNATTEKDGQAVTLWSWSASNGSASASQTQAARDAVAGHGAVEDFSHLVWNDMVDKVAEMRNAAGLSPVWNPTYLTQSNTKMSSTDKTMTAARYNSLRYNIGLYKSFADSADSLINYDSVVAVKNPGDDVIGSDFLDLMTGLNAAIRQVNSI